MATGNKGAGRPAGSPNKATSDARQAIASFVDGNAYRLTEWLDQVANGIKVIEMDGDQPIEKYMVPPNPAKAFDMFQSVVEYHIPKLARLEHSGSDTNPVVIEHNVSVFGELLKSIKMARQAGE
jgi:hypothetical protein